MLCAGQSPALQLLPWPAGPLEGCSRWLAAVWRGMDSWSSKPLLQRPRLGRSSSFCPGSTAWPVMGRVWVPQCELGCPQQGRSPPLGAWWCSSVPGSQTEPALPGPPGVFHLRKRLGLRSDSRKDRQKGDQQEGKRPAGSESFPITLPFLPSLSSFRHKVFFFLSFNTLLIRC